MFHECLCLFCVVLISNCSLYLSVKLRLADIAAGRGRRHVEWGAAFESGGHASLENLLIMFLFRYLIIILLLFYKAAALWQFAMG